MKIKAIILIAAVLTSLPAFGQFRWGVEAGMNLSHGYETSGTRAGFNVGVTGEYSFTKNWNVEAALKLSSQPSSDKYTLHAGTGGGHVTVSNVENSFTPYYLTLPVRAAYRFSISSDTRFSVAAGPALGIGLFGPGRVTLSDNSNSTTYRHSNVFSGSDSWPRFQYGVSARIAVELKRQYVAALEYSLMHLAGSSRPVDNMGVLSINLGYKF